MGKTLAAVEDSQIGADIARSARFGEHLGKEMRGGEASNPRCFRDMKQGVRWSINDSTFEHDTSPISNYSRCTRLISLMHKLCKETLCGASSCTFGAVSEY